MIAHEFITKLATKLQTTEENVAREYFQHLFLSHFYRKAESKKIVFKGGTALRLVFNSPRFSEDLDFSVSNGKTAAISDINQIIDKTLSEIKNEGIEVEKKVNPGTQGETSGGYLAIIEFTMPEFESDEIRIEISFRHPEKVAAVNTLISNEFAAPYVMFYLKESLLVSEKMEALLKRKKPRDFFDLYFILRTSKLRDAISQKKEGLKRDLLQAVAEIEDLRELKLFLPISHRHLLKDFKERLQKEIEEHIA